MKRSMLIIAALLMLVAMASMPKIAAAQENFEQINNLIANAKSPEDHAKIAQFFDDQAAKADAEARWHQSLLKVYMGVPRLSSEQMHCKRLVSVYKNAAKEDRELAAEYRNMK